jgi:hypothetical protein
VKELEDYLRGRERGAVPAILAGEFQRLGAPPSSLSLHEAELEAVRAALAWLREGDLLLLLAHERRGDVVAILESLTGMGWKPGDPLPRP